MLDWVADIFTKGDQYLSSVESHIEKSSYTGLIVIAVVVIVLFIGFIVFLLMHAEKKTDYVIRVWHECQESEAYK